jgi:hypothetical protein
LEEVLEEEFELVFDELFDDEFELELLEELELELEELFEDELELELLDEFELEFDELLPATIMEPSLLPVTWAGRRSVSVGAGYSRECAAVVASAAMPATSAELSFQWLLMTVTPFSDMDRCVPIRGSNGPRSALFPLHRRRLSHLHHCVAPRNSLRASASSAVSIGGLASIARR